MMSARPSYRFSLTALRRNTGGNVLAIAAASVLPILAVIGGAVDMSRNYMVMTRLQQACDAGVLAGRKAVGANRYDASAAAQATKMFNANYPKSYAGSYDLSFTPSSPDDGITVNGIAKASVPTAIMKIFGYKRQNLTADCAATFKITNTDVTMVLDVTGSMGWSISDGAGGTTTRIEALKKATKNFYDTMASASANSGARIRYSFVPYSQSVNAARLVKTRDPSFIVGGNIADTVNFSTRRPVYESTETRIETLTDVDAYECYELYSKNQPITGWWAPSNDGYTQGQNATKSGDSSGTYTFQYYSWNGSTAYPNTYLRGSSYWRTCQRKSIRKAITYDRNAPNARFLRYDYEQVATPINAYYNTLTNGSVVTRPSEHGSYSDRWAGCLREPDTVNSDTFTFNTLTGRIEPTAAKDLNIDLVPSTNSDRWKPLWPEIIYHREGNPNKVSITDSSTNPPYTYGYVYGACPPAATNLAQLNKSAFDAYVNSLAALGGTYHDIGILWGARLSSPDGIFSSNVNETAPNNGFVSRNMIFMTDGELSTTVYDSNSYGNEWNDHRIVNWTGAYWDAAGIQAKQNPNHKARFLALCEAVKAKNIRLWVVAFATSLDSNLVQCASPNSAFVSTNAAQLNDNFERIAKSMSDLRIVQ